MSGSEQVVVRPSTRSQASIEPAPVGKSSEDLLNDLARKIDARELRLGVIGLGYVGVPLALTAARAGYRVLGFDIAESRVALLNSGLSGIKHISDLSLQEAMSAGRFAATGDFERLGSMDAIVICVPTPLNKHREPDLSFVASTGRSIARSLRRGQLVVLESTTYPGTTEELLKPILEESGLRAGQDFFLAYSPEREDPGNATFDTSAIPKVVGGDGPQALAAALALYDSMVVSTVPVTSPAAAEAVKLTENVFRAVNIALVNELKILYNAMGIDVWEVIEAAKTKPFGFMPFYPGPGLGGHCIPIDPFYLAWKAREYDVPMRFIELAGEINRTMPARIVDRLARALDSLFSRGLNGSRILIVGAAYKKNVDDVRESPSLRLMELIEERGGSVDYHDPYIPRLPLTREHGQLAGRNSVPLEETRLTQYDAVLIATDHDGVDYRLLTRVAKLVVDARNACERAGAPLDKVVKA